MPIVPLLKEWSEIEPDRCSYIGGMFAIRGWTLTQEVEISDRLVNAEIQCAVQEAIEAQGWHWVVGRIAIEKGVYYKGRIAIQQAEDKPQALRLNTYLSTHSPTHVLLQSYVAALKAMAQSKPGDLEVVHGEIVAKAEKEDADTTTDTSVEPSDELRTDSPNDSAPKESETLAQAALDVADEEVDEEVTDETAQLESQQTTVSEHQDESKGADENEEQDVDELALETA